MAYPSDLVRTKNWGTEILTDGDLEGQYDLIINWIMASLHMTTGHTHSGGANDGPLIPLASIVVAAGANGQVLGKTGGVMAWVTPTSNIIAIPIEINGLGGAISTGIKTDITIPFACTLTGWDLLADQDGAIKIDVWKDTYANFPPTDADSICNGHEPEIAASGKKATDADISDWSDVTVDVGDILRINVDSCTTITRAVLILKATKN